MNEKNFEYFCVHIKNHSNRVVFLFYIKMILVHNSAGYVCDYKFFNAYVTKTTFLMLLFFI